MLAIPRPQDSIQPLRKRTLAISGFCGARRLYEILNAGADGEVAGIGELDAVVKDGHVRGTFPLHNKAPTGGSSCRGLCCRILPELTGKLQFLLRREQFIERVAFRLVYKVALWRSIFAGDAIEIA